MRLPLEQLAQDARYGMRALRRHPGFTAAAVTSLALGIGATVAIFSAVNALVLRPLAVRDPARLVLVSGAGPTMPYPQFEQLRERLRPIGEFSASFLIDRFDRHAGADRRQVRVGLVSGNYFSMLGLNASAGRMLTAGDDVPGAAPVAIISDAYWRRAFGAAPGVVGRSLQLSDTPFTIAGIAPKTFTGDWVGRSADLWVPYVHAPLVMPEVPSLARFPARMFGRLAAGVTIERAQGFALPVARRMFAEQLPATATASQRQEAGQAVLTVASAENGYSPQRTVLTQSLAILFVIVALVLLIGCANVANLLLARGAGRRREIALRAAIGASTARIVRQLLAESLLLAALGGAAGLLFASWATSVAGGIISGGPASMRSDMATPAFVAIALDLHPDARVFVFAFALSVVTAILFGLAPALRTANPHLAGTLGARDAGVSLSARLRAPRLLAIGQVALSLTLLIGAGLFIRSLQKLRVDDVGFDRDHLLVVWTDASQRGRAATPAVDFVRLVHTELASVPGVVSVGVSNGGILQGGDWGGPSELMAVEGQAPKAGLTVRRIAVTPDFFSTVGLRLIAGRDFTEQDSNTAPQVAIVDETFARFFFGDSNPIGRRFGSMSSPGYPVQIVGVVANAKTGTPRDRNGVQYVPYQQNDGRFMRAMISVGIRAAGDPLALAPVIRAELRRLDPELPIQKIDTIDEQIDDVLVQDRLLTTLSTFFGAIGMVLACVGLFGLLAYTAARRTSEIGVRLALGASPASIMGMMLRDSLGLLLGGIAIGLPVALGASRLLSAHLYAVSSADPLTIVVALLVMAGVGALAALIPARRASSVDPVAALRSE